MLKNNKGITLIALVITIIVLLILAIVSIRLVINQGILTKSKTAVIKYQEQEENEKVQIAVADANMTNNGGTITKASLQDALDKQFGSGKYTLTGDNVPFTVTIANGTGKT